MDEGICGQVPNFQKHRSDLKRGNAAAEEEKLASERNSIENRLSSQKQWLDKGGPRYFSEPQTIDKNMKKGVT